MRSVRQRQRAWEPPRGAQGLNDRPRLPPVTGVEDLLHARAYLLYFSMLYQDVMSLGTAAVVVKLQGPAKKVVPRLCECCRKNQAKVVSNRRNEIHPILSSPFSHAPYFDIKFGFFVATLVVKNDETRAHLQVTLIWVHE